MGNIKQIRLVSIRMDVHISHTRHLPGAIRPLIIKQSRQPVMAFDYHHCHVGYREVHSGAD